MGIAEKSRKSHYAVPLPDHGKVIKTQPDPDPGLVKVKPDKYKVLSFTKAWQSIYKDIFTFKPKVSAQSSKIAESLGTDFMSRQKQHIEKQKQYLKQATALHGRTSPIERTHKQNHANMTDIQLDEVQGDVNQNCIPSLTDSLADPYTPHPPDDTNTKCTSIPPDKCDELEGVEDSAQWTSPKVPLKPSRSKTLVGQNLAGRRPTLTWKSTQIQGVNVSLVANQEKAKTAKISADRAIKNKKIFTIQGPYPAIRECLRTRGWVEKFYKLHMSPPKKSPRVKKIRPANEEDDDNQDDDDDDDDDADDQNDDGEEDKIPPWDEDNGVYGLMSRVVRNSPPTFIWCVRRDAVDVKALKKDQYINHYGKATFTTKVGLCMNLRNTMWFEPVCPDTFFPRCYRLSHDEEKEAFVDDYKLTVCTSVLKWVCDHCADYPANEEELNSRQANTSPKKDNTQNKLQASPERELTLGQLLGLSEDSPLFYTIIKAFNESRMNDSQKPPDPEEKTESDSSNNELVVKRKKKGVPVPMKLLQVALEQCHKYIRFHDHADLDDPLETELLVATNWEQIFQWYYALVHDEGVIVGAQSKLNEINHCLDHLKTVLSQLDLDGYKNIWIVKPGAQSRGRGITLYNRLDEMLKLVNSSVVKKDSKFVVQKYIERPLLVHNTKFDIRQWFLVTDWNPLTLWFYQDCYLRFCSQQYTLEMLDESIHLSNNSIQKYYSNALRSSDLPDDNMWSSDQFKAYLRKHGKESKWDDIVYPNMKEAVICSILSTQDIVEYRKSAFELYGADFMLTEDLKPWLIEINSSPCMAYTTKVTAELCAAVLEDTVKVVLDRKVDKNADTGRFELAYKQTPVAIPPYIGINLSVEGQTIKKPTGSSPKKDDTSPSRHPPLRVPKDSPSHMSSTKKDSIDLSMNSNTRSQNKSTLNSGSGKKSQVHSSKSHASPSKSPYKNVPMACPPSATIGPFNPCLPNKKKKSVAPVIPPVLPKAVSDPSADQETGSITSSDLVKSITQTELTTSKDTAQTEHEGSDQDATLEVKQEFTSDSDDNLVSVTNDDSKSVDDYEKVNSKESVIEEESPSLKPQKTVTFPVMSVPNRNKVHQTQSAKVAKSAPDALLKDSVDQNSKEPKKVMEGSWAVEESNNYMLKPETYRDSYMNLIASAKNYRISPAIINRTGFLNPIEMIHNRPLKNNYSTGFKRHWQFHRGGYTRRGGQRHLCSGQPQKSPMVNDPDCPVLLMNQSRLHSPQPGSSSNSRAISPDPQTQHYRLQMHRPQSSSTEHHTLSPDPLYRTAAYIAATQAHNRTPRSNSTNNLIKGPHKSLSLCPNQLGTPVSLNVLNSLKSQRYPDSNLNSTSSTGFPGLVSSYVRKKPRTTYAQQCQYSD